MSSHSFGNPTDSDLTNELLLEYIQGLQTQIDELQTEIEELRADTNSIRETTTLGTNHIINELTGGKVKDYSTNPIEHRALVSDFNDRINELEARTNQHASVIDDLDKGGTDGPTEAWYAIIEAARRLSGSSEHSLPDNRVALYRENIAQATGRSKRMASNYIERFGNQKKGTSYRPYKRATKSSRNSSKQKMLVINLDVWGEDYE